MQEQEVEVPGTSRGKKKRAPQTRNRVAAILQAKGSGLGSGRSYERCKRVVEKMEALQASGHAAEAEMFNAAMEASKRGAYEISRMPDEAIFVLCDVVKAGEARNLIEARRIVIKLIEAENEQPPVTLSRCDSGMYRITSKHNTSSVLVSAQDLIHLSELIQSNMIELEANAGNNIVPTNSHRVTNS